MATDTLDRPRTRGRNRPRASWRRSRAVELAVEGYTYEQIAREVGYSNRSSAHRAVTTALAAREVEGVDELRRIECARLDTLQSALWPAATSGDVQAARTVADIVMARAKLLGLFRTGKPPAPLEPVTVIVPEGWTWNERRRGWDLTPEALEQHEYTLRCGR